MATATKTNKTSGNTVVAKTTTLDPNKITSYLEAMKLNDKQFKAFADVSRETAKSMYDIMVETYQTSGTVRKLSPAEALMLALEYWAGWKSAVDLGNKYGISDRSVYNYAAFVGESLVATGKFEYN